MKKNIHTVITTIFFILILAIITIQVISLRDNKLSQKEETNFLKIQDNLIIEDLKLINKEKLTSYEMFNNIKIGKLAGTTINSEKENFEIIKDSSKIIIEKDKSYLEKLQKEDKKIIKNNNLTTDIDLFGLIKEIKANTFFTAPSIIRQNKTLKEFTIKNISNVKNIYLLEGNVSGYMLNKKNNTKEIHITHNNNKYKFTVTDTKYFTDEEIYKVLSSLE